MLAGWGWGLDFLADFDPLSIADLACWYDASKITGLSDGDAVGTWSDLSGNNYHMTQATAANKPTYKTSIKNGLAIVRFATNDSLSKLGDSIDLKSACSVFAVVEPDQGGVQDCLISKYSGDLGFMEWNSPGSEGWGLHESGVAKICAPGANKSTSWKVVTWTWDGSLGGSSVGIVYVNGSQTDTGTYNVANLANNANLYIGLDNGTGFYDGDVGEILIYQCLLGSTERTNLQDYLTAKWDIS